MANLRDDDLRRIVTVDQGDYQEHAIAIAWEELRSRGIERVETAPVQRLEAPVASVRWLTFYIGASLVGGPLSIAHALYAGDPRVIAGAIGWAACGVINCVGLWKRRLWALRLNYFHLFLTALAVADQRASSSGDLAYECAILMATWGLPNYIYFRKRRTLFR